MVCTTIQELGAQLDVEVKIRTGAETLLSSLADDKKNKAEAMRQLVECNKRILYLKHEITKLRKESSSNLVPSTNDTENPPSTTASTTSFPEDRRDAPNAISISEIHQRIADIRDRIDVETKIQEASERLYSLYIRQHLSGSHVDKDTKSQAFDNLEESAAKVRLLYLALGKYKSLLGDQLNPSSSPIFRELHPSSSSNTKNNATFTGQMTIKVIGARHLHDIFNLIPADELKQENHTFPWSVTIKVDHRFGAKTKPIVSSTLTPNWQESFDIPLQRDPGELDILLHYNQDLFAYKPLRLSTICPFPNEGELQKKYSAWLELEPAGQIKLEITISSNPSIIDQSRWRLVRKPEAIREKRREKKSSHDFVLKTFYYQLVKCGVCHEFLLTTHGYHCRQCQFICHKRCADKSDKLCGSNNKEDGNDDKREVGNVRMGNHLPHRFKEKLLMARPAWCHHCGTLLIPGRLHVRCGECHIHSHIKCKERIPSLCGVSKELATKMRELQLTSSKSSINLHEESASASTDDQLLTHNSSLSDGIIQSHPSVGKLLDFHPDGDDYSSNDESTNDLMNKSDLVGGLSGKTLQSIGDPGQSSPLVDYQLLRVIGKGNFGKVLLVQKKSTQAYYAMKVLKKAFLLENDEVDAVMTEKRVFSVVDRHPFLVNLHVCFQSEFYIYFVMEFVAGGDLMFHIQQKMFSEAQARFYAAEILLAIEYLHDHGIVYRDLKLDNILLSSDGHVKLADYGLCKENMKDKKTRTFCGTPEFIAPEILREEPYGLSVDWWGFGVLIYEMLVGQAPFKGAEEEDIFEAVLHEQVFYPVNMNPDAVNLLSQLLVKDPAMRLGCGPEDARAVKSHIFFQGIQWDALLEKCIPPPFIPELQSDTDTNHFDEEFTSLPAVLSPVNTRIHKKDQLEFCAISWPDTVQI